MYLHQSVYQYFYIDFITVHRVRYVQFFIHAFPLISGQMTLSSCREKVLKTRWQPMDALHLDGVNSAKSECYTLLIYQHLLAFSSAALGSKTTNITQILFVNRMLSSDSVITFHHTSTCKRSIVYVIAWFAGLIAQVRQEVIARGIAKCNYFLFIAKYHSKFFNILIYGICIASLICTHF